MDEKWGSREKGAKFSLVERIWRKLLPFWVCVELYKNTMLSSYFSFAYQLGKIPLCILKHAEKWMGECEGKKEAGKVVGKERTKTIFVWKMS